MCKFNITAYLDDTFFIIYQYCFNTRIVAFVIVICLRHNTGVLQCCTYISTVKHWFGMCEFDITAYLVDTFFYIVIIDNGNGNTARLTINNHQYYQNNIKILGRNNSCIYCVFP